jgi:hypothetical protein
MSLEKFQYDNKIVKAFIIASVIFGYAGWPNCRHSVVLPAT